MLVSFGSLTLGISLFIMLLRSWFLSSHASARKKLLILDMNNLLVARIFAPKIQEEHPYALDYVAEADVLGKHFTWKRPGLDEFLDYCLEHFTVGVWSSAWKMNVDKLCGYTFGRRRDRLLFEFNQEHCQAVHDSQVKPTYEKNLTTVWEQYLQYNASNTIILDDSDAKMRNNPDKCVGICQSWGPWNTHKVETLDTVRKWLHARRESNVD